MRSEVSSISVIDAKHVGNISKCAFRTNFPSPASHLHSGAHHQSSQCSNILSVQTTGCTHSSAQGKEENLLSVLQAVQPQLQRKRQGESSPTEHAAVSTSNTLLFHCPASSCVPLLHSFSMGMHFGRRYVAMGTILDVLLLCDTQAAEVRQRHGYARIVMFALRDIKRGEELALVKISSVEVLQLVGIAYCNVSQTASLLMTVMLHCWELVALFQPADSLWSHVLQDYFGGDVSPV